MGALTPLDLPARITAKIAIDDETGCWNWTAFTDRGYSRVGFEGGMRPGHRVVYTLLVGPVPVGLELDHLCRNRSCVNPTHLEPVTHKENSLRGDTIPGLNARKTHCINGHPFSGDNLQSYKDRRRCKACQRLANRRYEAKRRAVAA